MSFFGVVCTLYMKVKNRNQRLQCVFNGRVRRGVAFAFTQTLVALPMPEWQGTCSPVLKCALTCRV